MQAVVCDRYGPPDVLVLRDVPRPAPGPAFTDAAACGPQNLDLVRSLGGDQCTREDFTAAGQSWDVNLPRGLVDQLRGQEGAVPDPAPLHPAGRGVPQGPDRVS